MKLRNSRPFGLAVITSAILLTLTTPLKADPPCGGASYSFDCSPQVLEAGQFLDLVNGYFNNCGQKITIIVTMKKNKFFPQDQVIDVFPLDPNIGVSTGAIGVPTTEDTPTGTDNITVECTDVTDCCLLNSCTFQLTLLPKGGMASLILVPVRWCAVEGSPQAEGHKAGEFARGDNLFALLRSMNAIWLRGALIKFIPAYGNIPVIAEPINNPVYQHTDPDPTKVQLGDLETPSGIGSGGGHEPLARMECENAWAAPELKNQKGTIAVNYRATTLGGTLRPDILGQSFVPDANLLISGMRSNDLCFHPRNLTLPDITPCQVVFVEDQGIYPALVDKITNKNEDPAVQLAHELGHSLLLGHGLGVDPDNEGLLPPTPGPRRFDCYCDPEGPVGGDQNPTDQTGLSGCSIVQEGASCGGITPLQAEQVREIALLVPGAVFATAADPSGELIAALPGANPKPADVQIVRGQISENPSNQITALQVALSGAIPLAVTNEYVFFVDRDDDATTGCDPSSLGFPTGFQGAELVVRLFVGLAGEFQTVVPTVWTCQNGSLVQVNDPNIRASSFTQNTFDGFPVAGYASIVMPDAVAGPLGTQVRIQVLARQLGDGGQLDRLPEAVDGGGVISLAAPPPLPQCVVSPQIVKTMDTTTLTVSGLIPNRTAEVYLGNNLMGTGPIDGSGNAQLSVVIPGNLPQGVLSVSVKVQGAAVSAESALVVLGATGYPTTTATLSPAANLAGWNNNDVTVALSATAAPNGPAVDHISYSATGGAQPIGPTDVPGSSAAIVISTEGETTITFFATDAGGATEPPEQITIKLDKTPPTISASRTPSPNGAGWNNTDVTVTFNCADSLSGMLSCAGSVTVTNEGANQSVSGNAFDVAFNSASTTLGGINIDKTPPTITCPANIVADPLNASGAPATFAATATDNLSTPTLNCVPQSNSLFPIGTNMVTCTATDDADNASSCSFTVTVRGPRAIEAHVLSQLTALRATVTSPDDAHKLDEAIGRLSDALTASLWINETHLQPKLGDQVFDRDKDAVQKLQELANKNSALAHVLQDSIKMKVLSTRILAEVAIHESSGNDLTQALKELAKGDASNNAHDAIDHYKNAWKHALHQ